MIALLLESLLTLPVISGGTSHPGSQSVGETMAQSKDQFTTVTDYHPSILISTFPVNAAPSVCRLSDFPTAQKSRNSNAESIAMLIRSDTKHISVASRLSSCLFLSATSGLRRFYLPKKPVDFRIGNGKVV